jgi:hypothetical protein
MPKKEIHKIQTKEEDYFLNSESSEEQEIEDEGETKMMTYENLTSIDPSNEIAETIVKRKRLHTKSFTLWENRPRKLFDKEGNPILDSLEDEDEDEEVTPNKQLTLLGQTSASGKKRTKQNGNYWKSPRMAMNATTSNNLLTSQTLNTTTFVNLLETSDLKNMTLDIKQLQNLSKKSTMYSKKDKFGKAETIGPNMRAFIKDYKHMVERTTSPTNNHISILGSQLDINESANNFSVN